MSTSDKQFFGPLTLHQKVDKPTIFRSDDTAECLCVLCDEKFTLPASEKQMLTHLFMAHRLVIADVNQIADLSEYMRYWRLRFRDNSLPFFCTTMLLDNKPDGTKSKNEEYYLLSDVLPEEKELRSNLQQSKLEKLLERHQFEREDRNYVKECLFCRHMSNTTRAEYLSHLYEKHNFHVAKPDNLIFIDELVDTIATKLEKLQCIYCEGHFKDRMILKEHMRKKGHKRINPDNKEYDKYFLVNYLGDNYQKPKSYKPFKNHYQPRKKSIDNENDSNDESDPEWSEWTEENGPLITCLLCEHTEMEYDSILDHMVHQHEFSFTKATAGLDFYHKVKIVNFIRRQVHLKQCLMCDTKFDDSKNLEKHLRESKHLILQREKWDRPEYYFPTYEDDLFLCFIQDDDESWWSGEEQEAAEAVDKQNDMSDNISTEMALAVLERKMKSCILLIALAVVNGMDIGSILNEQSNFHQHPYNFKVHETNISKVWTEAEPDGNIQHLEQHYTLTFLVNDSTVLQTSDDNIDDNTSSPNTTLIEFLQVTQCSDIEKVKTNSVKVLTAITENVAKCSKELMRILNREHGTVILTETIQIHTFPGALSYMRDEKNLFQIFIETEDDLPDGHTFDSLKFDRTKGYMVFATSKFMINRLSQLIKASNYVKAVKIAESIYRNKSTNFCKMVMNKLARNMFEEKHYSIMNFVFKLIEKDQKEIVDNCFPKAINQIFTKNEVRMLHGHLKNPLKIMVEDNYNFYIDCSDGTDNFEYWKITPVWNSMIDSLVYEVDHARQAVRFANDYLEHSAVRLEPAGINTDGEFLFCICRFVNGECFTTSHCRKRITMDGQCTADSSWFFKSKLN